MTLKNCRYIIAMKIKMSESKIPMIFLSKMAYNFDYDDYISSKMVLNGIPIRLARIFFPRHETGIFSVVSDELVLWPSFEITVFSDTRGTVIATPVLEKTKFDFYWCMAMNLFDLLLKKYSVL